MIVRAVIAAFFFGSGAPASVPVQHIRELRAEAIRARARADREEVELRRLELLVLRWPYMTDDEKNEALAKVEP